MNSRKLIYAYTDLKKGFLIKRYKRFLADIQLQETNEIITVYCPNTGPMIGLLDEKMAEVRIRLVSNGAKNRKYKYTLEMIKIKKESEQDHVWVGIHSSLANKMAYQIFINGYLPELKSFKSIFTEYKHIKNSRIDFYFKTVDNQSIFLEVKSVTLIKKNSNIAEFPDTISTRAHRHVRHLIEIMNKNDNNDTTNVPKIKGIIMFLIQRNDCMQFQPSIQYDPIFYNLCIKAKGVGIELLAYTCSIEPQSNDEDHRAFVYLDKKVPVILPNMS